MMIDEALIVVSREPDRCQCGFCIGAKLLVHEVVSLRSQLATAEQDRDAARQWLAKLREAVEPWGGVWYADDIPDQLIVNPPGALCDKSISVGDCRRLAEVVKASDPKP
jgi:hypothetical protein